MQRLTASVGSTEKPFPAYQGDEPYLFICYAHEDSGVVYDEMLWLHEAGVRMWYDDGVHVGTVWRRVLAEALEGASALVFMQTAQSVKSEFCLNEIRFALDEGKPVFVVTLEASRLPAELRLSLGDRQAMVKDNFTIGDFRRRLADALKDCLGLSEPPTQERTDSSATVSQWIRRRRRHRERRLLTVTVLIIDTLTQAATRSIAEDVAATGGEVLSQEGALLFAAFDSASAALSLLTQRSRNWRVGVSTGDLLFEDGLYHGSPITEAQALKDRAEPGQVLAAPAFYQLIDPSAAGEAAVVAPAEPGVDDDVRLLRPAPAADAH